MTSLFCMAISGVLFIVSFTKMGAFTIPEQLLGICLCITASIFLCTGFLLNVLEEFLKKQKEKEDK